MKNKCLIITILIILILAISYFLFYTITFNNNYNNFINEFQDTYGVKIVNIRNFSFEDYQKNKLTGPFICENESETRLYDIYIRKDENNIMKAYTKNERGAYMLLTNASIADNKK